MLDGRYRFVRISAARWCGKTALIKELCTLRPDAIHVDALQEASVADLASLLDRWADAVGAILIVRHADQAPDVVALARSIAALACVTHETSRIVVTTRTDLYCPFSEMPPEETLVLREPELAATIDEIAEILHVRGYDTALAGDIYAASGGRWGPVMLFIENMNANEPFSDVAASCHDAVCRLTYETSIAPLNAVSLDVLTMCAAVPGVSLFGLSATAAEPEMQQHVELLLRRNLVYTQSDDTRFYTWGTVNAALEEYHGDRVRQLREHLIGRLADNGCALDAAIALQNLGQMAASAPYLADAVRTGSTDWHEFDRAAAALSAEQIAQDPVLWLATYFWRRHIVDAQVLIAEAEGLTLAHHDSACVADLKSAVALARSELGEPHDVEGHYGELYRVYLEYLPGRKNTATRDAHANVMARAYSARLMGESAKARPLWKNVYEAAHARAQTSFELIALSELVLDAWLANDDEALQESVDDLRIPRSSPLFEPFQQFVQAVDGVGPGNLSLLGLPRARSRVCLMRAASAQSRDAAILWARRGIEEADSSGSVLGRAVLRLAAAAVLSAGEERSRILSEASHMVEVVELPRLIESVDALLRDDFQTACASTPFLCRFQHFIEPGCAVELSVQSATVLRNGAALKVSNRVLDLLLLLGASDTPLNREAISERLRPDDDPAEFANALKMTVRRARMQTGEDVIETLENGYALRAQVKVDLRELERLLVARSDELQNPQVLGRWFERLQIQRPPRLAGAEWFMPIERRIERARAAVAKMLCAAHMSAGKYAGNPSRRGSNVRV